MTYELRSEKKKQLHNEKIYNCSQCY